MALVSFPWVGSRALRSLRGRPSQVKGAFGVATRCRFAMPLRGTLDLRASTAPPGRGYGQARGMPSTTRSTPEPTTDQPRCGTALFPQVTLLDRPARTIMKPYPRKQQ